MQSLERLVATRNTMEDLGSIVRTMKTLSAVTVKHIEARRISLERFERATWLSLATLLKQAPRIASAEEKVSTSTAWILIGAERGFCGRFNERLITHVQSAAEAGSVPAKLLTLGSRFSEQMAEQGFKLDLSQPLPATPEGLEALSTRLMNQVDAWNKDGATQIKLIHTQREENGALAIAQKVIWPVPISALRKAQKLQWPTRQHPLVLAEPVAALHLILRQVSRASLISACMESLLCESSARLARLQIAEENIAQRLEDLRQMHNTLRQSAITSELQDITAAFDLAHSSRV